MEISEFDDIINLAKTKEEGSYNAYVCFAEKVKDKLVKDFFLELAEEEKEHIKLLDSLTLKSIKGYEKKDIEDLKLSKFLVEVSFDEEMTIQDAMLYAIKREDHAVEFYSKLLNATLEEQVRNTFTRILDEEKTHKRKLEEEYDNLVYQFF